MMPHQKNSFYPFWVASVSMLAHLSASTMPKNFIDFHNYLYEEPGVMREQSNIPGFSVGVYNNDHLGTGAKLGSFGYRVEFGFGQMRYVGSGMSSHLYLKRLMEGYISLLHLKYKDLRYQNTYKFYSGLGHRELIDFPLQRITSMGYATCPRDSQYFYIPVGVAFKGLYEGIWKLQHNIFVAGSQFTFLALVPGYSKNTIHSQDRGYGWDLSYMCPDRQKSWYLRYWDIEDSKIDEVIVHGVPTLFTEPKNFSLELGWRYHF